MLSFVIPLAVLLSLAFAVRQLRRRGLNRWLLPYILETPRRRAPRRGRPIHLLLCIADHYEPCTGGASPEQADARVERWLTEYPRLFGGFRDSDGRPPRHTFFYPMEQYDPRHVGALAELCRAGYGEVEVHLHHDNDTAESLRRQLLLFKKILVEEHGLLARHRTSGEAAYGFVHGNWALNNSGPHGQHCGVNNELDILRETGCYADFTLPSAPEQAQTLTINSIYYAVGDPGRCRSHDTGTRAGSAPAPANGLLLIQGPLLFDWSHRKWGLLPRLENGCIQGNQPACIGRLPQWLRARVQVPTRPDWFFVKLHTHGAPERNQAVLLGEPMVRFHQALADLARTDANFHFHYVTAREMYNLVRAAEDGWAGPVAEARDYELVWNHSPLAVAERHLEAVAC